MICGTDSYTKQGFFEVRQFNDVIKIYPRPTLVAVVTKI